MTFHPIAYQGYQGPRQKRLDHILPDDKDNEIIGQTNKKRNAPRKENEYAFVESKVSNMGQKLLFAKLES